MGWGRKLAAKSYSTMRGAVLNLNLDLHRVGGGGGVRRGEEKGVFLGDLKVVLPPARMMNMIFFLIWGSVFLCFFFSRFHIIIIPFHPSCFSYETKF